MNKAKRTIKIWIIAILVVLVSLSNGLIFINKVHASGQAIAISPMSQRVLLMPGETYRGSFIVANPAGSEFDLNFLITVGSYNTIKSDNSRDDYGASDIATVTNMNKMMEWIHIDNPTGVARPGEEITISFSIVVPEDAPAGGQYATLLARENPNIAKKDDQSVSVSEIMQMAHVIVAEVAGETQKIGSVIENNIPSLLLNNALEAISLVRNDGNVHTDAEYTLQIWPMFSDEEICTNEEEPETSLIMPGTERYHTQICNLPAVGIFRAKQTVKIFGETSIVEKTIIVCPLWLLFIIIFAIIALIIWLILRTKSRKTTKHIKE